MSSFVLTLKLKTNKKIEKELLKKSDCARQLYNASLNEAIKRLNAIKNTRKYRDAILLSKTGKSKAERSRIFKELNEEYGFRKYDLESFTTKCKNDSKFINKHLGTHVCQKISNRAFEAAQKVAFKKAKKVRFKPFGEFVSLEGKNNETFLKYSNGYLIIGEDVIKCIINPKDELVKYSLSKRIKFCRLICKKIKGKNVFYVQLVLDGTPYQKYQKGTEITGLDIGPSTIAIVNSKKAELKLFCSELDSINKTKKILQRKLDRSRRLNNPNNYNENKTIKKGRLKWHKSKSYIRTRDKLAETERKLKDKRYMLHNILANEILKVSNVVKTEDLEYKKLQQRFGRSTSFRSPATFISILKRKIEASGGTFIEVNTYKTKLSQTCQCSILKKKSLSERWHKCSNCKILVQRDIYSAYLVRYVSDDKLDFKSASDDFKSYEKLFENCIKDLKTSNAKVKSFRI